MVPTSYYLALSGLLFALGMVGVLTRRTAIMVFLSVELMLIAPHRAPIAFARAWGHLTRRTPVVNSIPPAAASAVTALSVTVAILRCSCNHDEVTLRSIT